MLEILMMFGAALVLLIGALHGHGRRRYPPGFQVLPFSTQITLSTLADNTAVNGGMLGGNLTEDYFAFSQRAVWTLRNHTAGEGPISVGIAHGDYTAAEIVAYLSLSLLGPANKTQQEISRRLIRTVGVFDGLNTEESLNDGKPIKTPMKWVEDDGHDFIAWAFNRSGASLTTGTVLDIQGKYFGKWLY